MKITIFLGIWGLLWTVIQPALAGPAEDAAGLQAFSNGAFAEALQQWSASAAAGDGQAARYIGVLYDAGEGVRRDQARALGWYRRAAALGDAAGMFNVAVSYDSGTGTARDRREAARWYARAAARHNGRAAYNLALMYELGDGVRHDPDAAARWFRAAARSGVTAAVAHLPLQARVTLVVSRAPDQDATFLAAQRALLSRTPADAARAMALFRQVAARGDASAAMARYDMAWCYENGIGVPVDRRAAYGLYIEAAASTRDPAVRDLAETGATGLYRLQDAPAATALAPASR